MSAGLWIRARWGWSAGITALVLSGAFTALVQSAHGAEVKCTDQTPAPGDGGYKRHGDRCEGRFQPKVAAGVFPHSLTLGAVSVPAQGDRIVLKWNAAATAGNLSLRVRDLDDVPYQMKTVLPGELTEYAWPKVQPASLGIKNLAVMAQVGNVCVPAFGDSGDRNYYLASFHSSQLLSAVNLKVIAPDKNVVWRKGPFDSREQLITAKFPRASLPASGEYKVTLVGLAANGSVSASISFRHL